MHLSSPSMGGLIGDSTTSATIILPGRYLSCSFHHPIVHPEKTPPLAEEMRPIPAVVAVALVVAVIMAGTAMTLIQIEETPPNRLMTRMAGVVALAEISTTG